MICACVLVSALGVAVREKVNSSNDCVGINAGMF